MPKAKNETKIPLHCSLCPKNPQFSDVSHLLTHISSKSHLSHRFKLQIRAQSEIGAVQQLDDFDTWYKNNNLDAMLADRLAVKEQKKAAKDRKAKISAAPTKKEKSKPDIEQSLSTTPIYRAPVPRMQPWPPGNLCTQSSSSFSDWQQSPLYATPTSRRSVPNFANEATPAAYQIDPNLTTPWKPNNNVEAKSEDKLSESIKLKGIQWPGMDLFDSATSEMRRMRNQRKDSSVLDQMKATSAEVIPDEVVYNVDGSISHTRDIFGPPSCETSPVYKIEPSPKKRKPRSKAALANLDVNVPRLRARRVNKVAPVVSPYKRPAAPQQNRVKLGFGGLGFNNLQHNPLVVTSRSSYNEEEEEFQLTAPKKRAFNIFQDVYDIGAHEMSPVGTESPLEEARFDFSSTVTLPSYPRKSPGNHPSPSPTVKSTSVRIFGKENDQSEMSSRLQASRAMTTAVYQPHVVHDFMISSHNPLNPLHQSPYGINQYGQHLTYQGSQGFDSSFQGNFKSVNGPPRSPAYAPTGYITGPSHPSHNTSCHSFGYSGHSNNMHSSGAGHCSRPSSSHGASIGNTLYQGSGSRQGSSHSASNPINMYGRNASNDSRPGSAHGSGSTSGMYLDL